MEFHGEVGIFEQISGQNQDDGFVRLHEALPQQFLQAGQSDGGSGFTANAFRADFGFGLRDFDFAHLLTGAAGGLKNLYSFFPRSRVADADRRGASLGLHADQVLATSLAQSAHQRVGALRLNHGQLRQTRNQSEIEHFQQRLADRGTVAEVAAGHDDVVGRLPVELLQQFEGESFLSFEAERVDGVQLVDGGAPHEFLQQAEAAVEVGAQLAGEGAVVERLGEFAPGDFAFGHEHQAAHAAARGIGGHGCRRVAGGSAGHPAVSGLAGEGGGDGHAGVLERAGGVHALMLGKEARNAGDAGGLRKFVEWSVAFAQRDDVLLGLQAREEARGIATRR